MNTYQMKLGFYDDLVDFVANNSTRIDTSRKQYYEILISKRQYITLKTRVDRLTEDIGNLDDDLIRESQTTAFIFKQLFDYIRKSNNYPTWKELFTTILQVLNEEYPKKMG